MLQPFIAWGIFQVVCKEIQALHSGLPKLGMWMLPVWPGWGPGCARGDDADAATCPQVCPWLTSHPETTANSALFVKPCVAPSRVSSGSCWDHFASLQHSRLIHWSVCSDLPKAQCLSSTFPLFVDAVGFRVHKTRLCLVLLSLFASHSSCQVSHHYIHPLLQMALCEQCVPSPLLIPSQQ